MTVFSAVSMALSNRFPNRIPVSIWSKPGREPLSIRRSTAILFSLQSVIIALPTNKYGIQVISALICGIKAMLYFFAESAFVCYSIYKTRERFLIFGRRKNYVKSKGARQQKNLYCC